MFRSTIPTVFVSDLSRAVDFYTQTLGLPLTFHAPGHWAQVQTPDKGSLGLHPAGPHSPPPGGHGGIQIGFLVDRPIDQVVSALEGRGVRFHGPVQVDAKGGVKLAFFGDPDGNDLYLCESKS